MKKRSILIALAATAAVFAQPSTVTLTGPVYDAFGQLYGGSVLVQGQVKTSAGMAIAGTTRTVFITSGALNLALVPNAGAIPSSTSYLVTFNNGDKWTCVVPGSGPVAFTTACAPNAPPPLPTYQGPAGPPGVAQAITGDISIPLNSTTGTVLQVDGQAAASVAGSARLINVAAFDSNPSNSCAGDSTHDDTIASNLALAFAASAGGGRVTWPHNGNCQFKSFTAGSSTLILNVPLGSKGITADFNGAVPHIDSGLGNNLTLIGNGLFSSGQRAVNQTLCSILPAVRGQWYVDLNGACEAWTFLGNHAVYIQSGTVNAGTPFNAETNKLSFVIGTRLYLSYPLSHSYSNDSINPFGIADIDAITNGDIIVENLHTPANFVAGVAFNQVVHFLMRDSVMLTGNGVLPFFTGVTRDYTLENVVVSSFNPGHQYQFSTAQAGLVFRNVSMFCHTDGMDAHGGYSTQLNISEGAADIDIEGGRYIGDCGNGGTSGANTSGFMMRGAYVSVANAQASVADFSFSDVVNELDITGTTFNFPDTSTGKHNMFLGGTNCDFSGNRIFTAIPSTSSIVFNKALTGCTVRGNRAKMLGAGATFEFGDSSGGGHGFVFEGNNIQGNGGAWGLGIDSNGSVSIGPTIQSNTITGFATGVLFAGALSNEGSYIARNNNLGGNTAQYSPSSLLLASGIIHTDAFGNQSASAVDLSGSDATGTLATARLPAFSGDTTSSAGSTVLTTTTVGGAAATNANTPSTLVKRDASGNFLAGQITLANAVVVDSLTGGGSFVLRNNGTQTFTLGGAASTTLDALTGNLILNTAGANDVSLGTNGVSRWSISNGFGGALIPDLDNTYDVGVSGNLPRRVNAYQGRFQTELSTIIYSAAGTPLPTASGNAGVRAMVSDATSPTYLGIYVSGGAIETPVFSNGTNWLTY